MYKILFMALMLAGCSQTPPAPPAQAAQQSPPPSLSDEGQLSCAKVGGFQTLARQLDGSLLGVCTLPNGKRCAGQALIDGCG